MTGSERIPIAVIGGSGLYQLAETNKRMRIATPFGSAELAVGTLGERRIAFLARHGAGHSLPPHRIDYRSNIWALASLGVRAIVSSAAVGSLTPALPPGSLVLPDQYIDRTTGRPDTFYDGNDVQHLPSADPFCPRLRSIAADALVETNHHVSPKGTVVVVQGPRFSTRAESQWFRAAGGDLVNMTLYPELPLAAELNIGTVTLAFVTDVDSGEDAAQASGADGADADTVFRRLADAQPRILAALGSIVAAIDDDYTPRQLISPAAVRRVLERGAR